MARTMLLDSKSPLFLWMEAVRYACNIQNSMPTSSLPETTPWEACFGSKPDLSHFLISGSSAHNLIPAETNPSKLGTRVLEGLFVGLSHKSEGWRCWVPSKGKIIEAWNVQIFEWDFTFMEDQANALEVRKWEMGLEGCDTSIQSRQPSGPPFIQDNRTSLSTPPLPTPSFLTIPAPSSPTMPYLNINPSLDSIQPPLCWSKREVKAPLKSDVVICHSTDGKVLLDVAESVRHVGGGLALKRAPPMVSLSVSSFLIVSEHGWRFRFWRHRLNGMDWSVGRAQYQTPWWRSGFSKCSAIGKSASSYLSKYKHQWRFWLQHLSTHSTWTSYWRH